MGSKMADFAGAIPEDMHRYGTTFSSPEFIFRTSTNRPKSACVGGMTEECDKLTEANKKAIESIETTITHIMQGFAAYKSMILSCAACYIDGNNMSEIEFERIITHQEQNLPDKAQVFLDPIPEDKA
ncbi:hypothetical protein ACWDV4_06545 [Micromonospora sp. NPDC003197]